MKRLIAIVIAMACILPVAEAQISGVAAKLRETSDGQQVESLADEAGDKSGPDFDFETYAGLNLNGFVQIPSFKVNPRTVIPISSANNDWKLSIISHLATNPSQPSTKIKDNTVRFFVPELSLFSFSPGLSFMYSPNYNEKCTNKNGKKPSQIYSFGLNIAPSFTFNNIPEFGTSSTGADTISGARNFGNFRFRGGIEFTYQGLIGAYFNFNYVTPITNTTAFKDYFTTNDLTYPYYDFGIRSEFKVDFNKTDDKDIDTRIMVDVGFIPLTGDLLRIYPNAVGDKVIPTLRVNVIQPINVNNKSGMKSLDETNTNKSNRASKKSKSAG